MQYSEKLAFKYRISDTLESNFFAKKVTHFGNYSIRRITLFAEKSKISSSKIKKT